MRGSRIRGGRAATTRARRGTTALEHDAAGDQPRRCLVDRVREGEEPAHVHAPTIPIPDQTRRNSSRRVARLASLLVTVRLTVDASSWRQSVDSFVDTAGELLPVVKGNGYGFGLPTLASEAARLASAIAVGTVHEAATVAGGVADVAVVVLTPIVELTGDLPRNAVPTVGGTAHVAALTAGGMVGHGVGEAGVVDAAVRSVSGRPRRAHCSGRHARDATSCDTCSTSRCSATGTTSRTPSARSSDGSPASTRRSRCRSATSRRRAFASLRQRHPERRFELRAGTALWHGDKSFLHLSADVIDVRPVAAGDAAGYRAVVAPADGTIVMIGAGTAAGVAPLQDGRSPFHHRRRRLAAPRAAAHAHVDGVRAARRAVPRHR